MSIKKPMLSGTVKDEQLDELKYPVMVSPKLDGIRCLIHPDLGPVTRSFKPIPNVHVRAQLEASCDGHALDGELIALGKVNELLDFNETQGIVMRHADKAPFMFQVFDCFNNPDDPFVERFNAAKVICIHLNATVQIVPHRTVSNSAELLRFHQACMVNGYEGTMIRSTDGPYKQGRSTFNQGYLLKLKEWADAEGTITELEELEHNKNPSKINEVGRTQRSTSKDGMVGAGTLGTLILDTDWGSLRVGSGMDHALRQEIWDNKAKYIGKTVTFKYQPSGMKDHPRFPIFMRFREVE